MLEDLLANNELVAITILVLGIVAARLGSVATGALLGLFDRRTARLATSDKSVISPSLIRVTRAIVFWLILILAVSYALRTLGVGAMSTMLASVIDFIPQLLVGFAIVVAGHVLGLVARHLSAELREDITTESLGPRLLHAGIAVVALVMGLKHIGVDITFITQLLLIIIGITGGGLMLAFALGAQQHVANLLASRETTRFVVGDRIRVGDVEGEVVDIRATGIDIATGDGIASVPAAVFARSVVVLRPEQAKRG